MLWSQQAEGGEGRRGRAKCTAPEGALKSGRLTSSLSFRSMAIDRLLQQSLTHSLLLLLFLLLFLLLLHKKACSVVKFKSEVES